LAAVATQLEQKLGIGAQVELALALRVENILAATIAWRAAQFSSAAVAAKLHDLHAQQQPVGLAAAMLDELETRLGIAPPSDFLPERIKAIRQKIVGEMPAADAARRKSLDADLETAFIAVQLYSYRPGYIEAHPTIERVAETIDKLEEDVLGVRSANIRGRRRAVIAFGDPIMVDSKTSREGIPRLNDALRSRVQALIDGIETQRTGQHAPFAMRS
jgi:hypothetical protein